MAESSIRADGSKIKAARDAKRWSQERLAREAGYALSVIQKLEQGTYFSLRCLECCAEALDTLVADLLVSSEATSEICGSESVGTPITRKRPKSAGHSPTTPAITAPASYAWIEAERMNDVLLVRITRQPHNEKDVHELDSDLKDIIKEEKYRKVVVSLAAITYWASITYMPLLGLMRHLREQNGRLKLCDVNPLVHELFRCHRIDRVLEIVDSSEIAQNDW